MLRIGIGGLLQCRNLTIQLFLDLVLAPFTRDPLHTLGGELGRNEGMLVVLGGARLDLKAVSTPPSRYMYPLLNRKARNAFSLALSGLATARKLRAPPL